MNDFIGCCNIPDPPEYTNKEYWDKATQLYIQAPNKFSGPAYIFFEDYLWEYFKFCLTCSNRYFFQHPLIPYLESVFQKHTIVLSKGTEIHRARLDEDYKLQNEWCDYQSIKTTPETIKKIEKFNGHTVDIKTLQEKYESDYFKRIKKRIESGFQGFDAQGSTAPPTEKASAGRCNLKGVSYLYAALEEHTAVAEIRPHITDTISIAVLKPLRDLKLINFDYNPEDPVEGKDFIFNDIQKDFSLINRDQSNDYTITQYVTSLIEHLGYDGLCFRSSLVDDGTNYVIFNPEDCNVDSSKLCLLSKVIYDYGQFKESPQHIII